MGAAMSPQFNSHLGSCGIRHGHGHSQGVNTPGTGGIALILLNQGGLAPDPSSKHYGQTVTRDFLLPQTTGEPSLPRCKQGKLTASVQPVDKEFT
jgi:hypothetical protein